MSTIAENIAAIRARIDAAARTTGRTGADITLVAATKMNDAARVREAVAAGIDACGENRVQEMTEKLRCTSSATCKRTRSGRSWERSISSSRWIRRSFWP